MKKILLFAVFAIFFAGCAPSVNYTPPVVNPSFGSPDINQVLKEKYSFQRLDMDRNNRLDFEEFFNIDKDNWIMPSKRESEYKTFQQYDLNRDAYLDKREYNNYLLSIGMADYI